jgi:hypothetical protein
MDTRDKFLAPVTVPQARSNALIERGNRRVDFGTAEVTGFATSKELRAFSDKLIRSELFRAQIRIHLRARNPMREAPCRNVLPKR